MTNRQLYTISSLRKGFTLVELMIVLALLAIIAAVSATAFRLLDRSTSQNSNELEIARARHRAIESGRPVTITVRNSTGAHDVLALPDGGVVADSSVHVNRWTGALDRER
jgi:prepilin-type N-terminal cleavage/methylation domain-containing protein